MLTRQVAQSIHQCTKCRLARTLTEIWVSEASPLLKNSAARPLARRPVSSSLMAATGSGSGATGAGGGGGGGGTGRCASSGRAGEAALPNIPAAIICSV